MTDSVHLAQFTATILERVRAKVRVARMDRITPTEEDMLRAIEGLAEVAERLCGYVVALAEDGR